MRSDIDAFSINSAASDLALDRIAGQRHRHDPGLVQATEFALVALAVLVEIPPDPEHAPLGIVRVQHAVAVGIEVTEALKVGLGILDIGHERDLVIRLDHAVAVLVIGEEAVIGRRPGHLLAIAIAVQVEERCRLVERHQLDTVAVQVENDRLGAAAAIGVAVAWGAVATGVASRRRPADAIVVGAVILSREVTIGVDADTDRVADTAIIVRSRPISLAVAIDIDAVDMTISVGIDQYACAWRLDACRAGAGVDTDDYRPPTVMRMMDMPDFVGTRRLATGPSGRAGTA